MKPPLYTLLNQSYALRAALPSARCRRLCNPAMKFA
jgi:hypothetical protein